MIGNNFFNPFGTIGQTALSVCALASYKVL
jgi:hypothetical protein